MFADDLAHGALQVAGRLPQVGRANEAVDRLLGVVGPPAKTCDLGLKGLYYSQDFSRHGYERNVDHAAFAPFWDKIVRLNLPVLIELSSTPSYDAAGYMGNLLALGRLLKRHPAHPFVCVMGPPAGHFARGGKWEIPDEALEVYRRDNLLIEVMFPITWGGVWDYPYPEAQELIRGMRDRFGAGKLVWGSDMPNVERFCTYQQCLDYVRRHCGFLSAAEKDRILGDNVAALFGLMWPVAK